MSALTADDHIAIQQLYARYASAADARDAEAWLACWADDAVFVVSSGATMEGPEALRVMIDTFIADTSRTCYHCTCNLVVEPAEDGARGQCYLLLVDAAGGRMSLLTALVYRDELVVQDGEWRFRRRTTHQLQGQSPQRAVADRG